MKKIRNTRFTAREEKQMLGKYNFLQDFYLLLKEYYQCNDLTREQYYMLSTDTRRLLNNLASVIGSNTDSDNYHDK